MLAPLYDFEVRHSKGPNQRKQPDRDQRTRFARQLLANAPRIAGCPTHRDVRYVGVKSGHPASAMRHHTCKESAATVLRPEKRGQKRVLDMPDDLRISVEDLKRRKQSGEDFVFIDTRNPQAWGQSDATLPNAMRVPVDDFEKHLDKIPRDKSIVAYCT